MMTVFLKKGEDNPVSKNRINSLGSHNQSWLVWIPYTKFKMNCSKNLKKKTPEGKT